MTTQKSRHLELMPLNAITGADKNPKKHASEDIGKSIGRFGYVEPCVLDERTNRLVAGHGRVQALRVSRKKGEAPPQGIEERDGEWFVPVLRGWASRSDTEASAYLVASNHLTTKGGWENSDLLEMLQELDKQAALEGTGYGSEDLDALLKSVALEQEAAEGKTDPDEVPEVGDAGSVRLGDLYELGEHRLLCGDSTRESDVDLVLGGKQADLVWTDPPYGVSYESKAGKVHNDGADQLAPLLKGAFASCFRAMKPGAFIYVAHPAGGHQLTFYDEIRSAGFRYKAQLVWVKDSLVLGHSDYHFRHEPISYAMKPAESGRRGRGGSGWYGDDAQTSVFEVPKPKRSEDHPTMKPIELVEAMMKNSSAPGHVVFEPFSGSGTTLMACERLGRSARAIELDPVYVNRTIARWEAFTGKVARKLEGAS